MKRRVRLASFRIGYEEFRCGQPFRVRRRAALAYEQGRLAAAEMQHRGLALRPWERGAVPPPFVMAFAAADARRVRAA